LNDLEFAFGIGGERPVVSDGDTFNSISQSRFAVFDLNLYMVHEAQATGICAKAVPIRRGNARVK